MWPLPEKPTGLSDGVTVIDVDPAQPPLPRRRDRPIGVRRGPPPPPPGWIRPPPGQKGLDEIIVIGDNATIKSGQEKDEKATRDLRGSFQ
jgi:hypothetical protein